jgi:uncharacterized protein (TIGR03083 family)
MASEPPADDEYLSAYKAIQERLASVVGATDCQREVPGCPSWQVRDVLAHMAGLCEDWIDQHLDGYASDSWTASQVERFATRSCPEILHAWASALEPFARVEMMLLGRPPARWAFGDAVIHEADIRGALEAGRVPDDAVYMGLGGTLSRWAKEVIVPGLLPRVHIRTPDGGEWLVGPEEGEATVTLNVETYELFRALAGRRHADQVRRWDWSVDPEAYVDAGLPYPFRWADSVLAD